MLEISCISCQSSFEITLKAFNVCPNCQREFFITSEGEILDIRKVHDNEPPAYRPNVPPKRKNDLSLHDFGEPPPFMKLEATYHGLVVTWRWFI